MVSAASRPVLSWAPTLVTPGGNTTGAASTKPSPSKLVFNRERILHLDSRIGASCWCTKHVLRIVVLPPDLLPRQLFLGYPPSAAIGPTWIFVFSWRHLELIPPIFQLCFAGVFDISS